MENELILALNDQQATLERVGGKGASLARLCSAGLPVPDGFHVTTAAYQAFVQANGLQAMILEQVSACDISRPETLETASCSIQARFAAGQMPEAVQQAILQAYAGLAGDPAVVAVRSSATAEDLPEASFAGQQDTYLNIHGTQALLEAVKKCWASLWTARAIAYRSKNQIDNNAVALAVVVQKLILADAAGILFTANPLNGRRGEILINAAWGLGEAVVSGLVTPDVIVLAKGTGKVLRQEIAEKQVMTARTESGTRETPVAERQKKQPAISLAQAAKLARYGEQIEALYDQPMDIEWALAGGQIAILQARPITNLAPDWTGPVPKAMYARGSLAEHLPNPVTPLFATLGLRAINKATEELAALMGFDAGEAEYQYRVINGYVYAGFLTTAKVWYKMIKSSSVVMKRMMNNASEHWRQASRELSAVIERWEAVAAGERLQKLPALTLLEGAAEIFTQTGRLYTVLQSSTLPAASSSEVLFNRVYGMVRRKGDPNATALLMGFETVPLKAEKALYDLAAWVKTQPGLVGTLQDLPAGELAGHLAAGTQPEGVPGEAWAEWHTRFSAYMSNYGATVYELDFANPTPAEDPIPALDAIKMYLTGQGSNPHGRHRAAQELRERSTQAVLARLKWPVKGWFKKSLGWAQSAGPAREDCLVDLGKANPLVRRLLGELGRRLAANGAVETGEDVYWLQESEAAQAAGLLERGEPPVDLRSSVAERKAAWQAQLKLTPPAMMPENSGWAKLMPWHKTDQSGNTLKGVGASAGKVTAPACVLLSPSDFGKMKPGAVLVAVTTTPAWTPLFAMASAVVTDIGGPLSHGSIVAREYGIPAVMATGMGTRKIKDGQMITVDGSAGTITLS